MVHDLGAVGEDRPGVEVKPLWDRRGTAWRGKPIIFACVRQPINGYS